MVLCGSTSWGGWFRNSDAVLQIPQKTETKFWKGDELIRLRYTSMRRLKDRPAGVAHWLNTRASCFSKSEWTRTRDIDEVATNTSTSVFLKKGSSTVGMTHPEVYTQCTLWIIFQTGGNRIARKEAEKSFNKLSRRVSCAPEARLCKLSDWDNGSFFTLTIHEVTQDHTVSRTRHTKQCFEYMN